MQMGIAWMLTHTVFGTGMDALGKHLVATYPAVQVVWMRLVVHALFLFVALAPGLTRVMVTRCLGWQVARSASLMLATLFFVGGLKYIPLAEGMAIIFLSPIVATALSGPLLGEAVGVRRWMGVLAGFLGAMIIIRPGSGFMEWAALLPLGAALMGGLYHATTRKVSLVDPPLTTFMYTPLAGAVGLAFIVPFLWVPPTGQDWLLMLALGVFGGLAHMTFIKALQLAPVPVVSPFSYANLFWATLLGFLMFGDLPDGWTVLGAAVIAGAGLYIFYRERQVKRRRMEANRP